MTLHVGMRLHNPGNHKAADIVNMVCSGIRYDKETESADSVS